MPGTRCFLSALPKLRAMFSTILMRLRWFDRLHRNCSAGNAFNPDTFRPSSSAMTASAHYKRFFERLSAKRSRQAKKAEAADQDGKVSHAKRRCFMKR
ncbi:hypothetical protein AJ87_40655 [Rhizobium yanglingense]|nr:hypothetical protein AJ87_40655 [Rhizobium yanglingense]